MTKPRAVETDRGIQHELTVRDFDEMARNHRDKGYTDIKALAQNGLTSGHALEIGPGPGYMGLEWLKGTQGTTLVGLEISAEMIKVAERNAAEYGLADRARYVSGDATEAFPFGDASFDAVFSFGSMHEWSRPENVFDEIHRVLRPGGRFLISDLRRDISFIFRFVMRASVRSAAMKAGLGTSIAASYTSEELERMLSASRLGDFKAVRSLFGMHATGMKQ